MTVITTISERLKKVLQDLEKTTNDIEAIQTQISAVANDDFLIRTLTNR